MGKYLSFLLVFLLMGEISGNVLDDVIDTLQILFSGNLFVGDDDVEQEIYPGPQPRVQTTSGLVYGFRTQVDQSFYGIPFAEPPVGRKRFYDPVPLENPDQVLNKTVVDRVSCTKTEDCLVLNIHAPYDLDLSDAGNSPTNLRPVMFWIHGGAFSIGSGTESRYDGRYLSNATNTIVVSINYRLGPFGFMVWSEGEDALTGNQGLKDQQLAMQWVQDNIEGFGGDKNKVTIFGESAGAQSVMFHLVSDVSKPLFHRAIMQSIPAEFAYPTYEQATDVTTSILRSLGCNPFGNNIKCLQDATREELGLATVSLVTQSVIKRDISNAIEPFRPYIDGFEYQNQPMRLFQRGQWHKDKPVILGTTSDEMDVIALFKPTYLNMGYLSYYFSNSLLFGLTMGSAVTGKYYKMEGPNIRDYGLILSKEITDLLFSCPSRALARFASSTADGDSVFFYTFSHSLDGPDCEEHLHFLAPNICGYSFHSSELPFVFRTIEHMGMVPDAEDFAVMDQFTTYWGNFAWTGNPSHGREKPLPLEYAEWLPYVGVSQVDLRVERRPGFQVNQGQMPKLNISTIDPWGSVRIDEPNSYMESAHDEDICDFWESFNV